MCGPKETGQGVPSGMDCHPSVKERNMQKSRDRVCCAGSNSTSDFSGTRCFIGFLVIRKKRQLES